MYLHMHDGEQVIYHDTCPVCIETTEHTEQEKAEDGN